MIFFDLDETLIDQRHAEFVAANALLERYGKLLPNIHSVADFCTRWRELREEHARTFLDGRISFHEQRIIRVRELFAENGTIVPKHELGVFVELYRYHYSRGWLLFPDVIPCLDSLRSWPLGIISNGNSAQQRRKLISTGIYHRFAEVVISEDVGYSKPGLRIFQFACRQSGSPSTHCLYVGDRLEVDAYAARAAGLRTVWLNRSGGAIASEVDTISSLEDLANVVRAQLGEPHAHLPVQPSNCQNAITSCTRPTHV